jgi:hypothetical protein
MDWQYPLGLTTQSTPLDCALAYAKLNYRVFPVIDKIPWIRGWPWRATVNEAILREWWAIKPQSDVGWALPNVIVALDLDVNNDKRGFLDFKKVDGRYPLHVETPTALTKSGGYHLFFGVEPGRIGNSNGKHGRAIDVKTKGGYVVLPTPLNGRQWLKPPGATPKQSAPKWLLKEYRPPEPMPMLPQVTAGEHTLYGEDQLRRLRLRIINAGRGQRDQDRNKYAFMIGQYVGGGELEANDAYEQMLTAALAQDWTDQRWTTANVTRRVSQAFNAGIKRPRNAAWDRMETQQQIHDAAAAAYAAYATTEEDDVG